MKNKLKYLYDSKWEALCAAMAPIIDDETLDIKPTCPLLLSINDEAEIESSDIRLMVFGQETNSWYGQFENAIEPIMSNYDEFFNKGTCWSYGGQFWNGVNRFVELLQLKYPSKKISVIWNNVVKIGKFEEKGFPPDYIYEIEKQHFSILKEELRIIQPTIVLFLSGPNYDSVIVDKFEEVKYSQLPSSFSVREIAKLNLIGVPFAFRTYHPNYLWRNDINRHFQTIIDKINIYNSDNVNLKSTEQLEAGLEIVQRDKVQFVMEKNYEQAAQCRDKENAIIQALEFRKEITFSSAASDKS